MNEKIPGGYCQCGCGLKTNSPKKTNRIKGLIRGVPYRYVIGHHGRKMSDEFKVLKNGCWQWQHGKTGMGYGTFCFLGKPTLAHRYYYEWLIEKIPHGYVIDHLCRNRDCVNPNHMEPVLQGENARRGTRTRLNETRVREIKALLRTAKLGDGIQIARRYGIAQETVSGIKSGRTWAHVS